MSELNNAFEAAKAKWKAERDAFESGLLASAKQSRVELWIERHPITSLILAIVAVLGVIFTLVLL